MRRYVWIALLVGLCLSSVGWAEINRQIWDTGSVTESLAGVRDFFADKRPDMMPFSPAPDIDDVLTVSWWGDRADAYYGHLWGWVTIPESGTYTWYIHGDNNSILYVSTDETWENVEEVASVDGWSNIGEWTNPANGGANTESAPFTYSAGQTLAVWAIMVEGSGGDNLGIGWTLPGSSTIEYISDYVSIIAPVPTTAKGPVPDSGLTDIPRDVVLSWTPGEFAVAHDVYWGTVFDDVNNASRDNPLGVLLSEGQAESTFDPPGLLEYDQTYYWRIDEVNAPPDSTIYKGKVWSLTTEPLYYAVADVNATTSLPTAMGSGEIGVTVDGSGLVGGQHGVDDPDMWAGESTEGEPAWIQYDFDRVYKLYGIHVWNYNGLYELYLGFGLKDVTIEYATEPNEWISLGDVQLARSTSRADYAGEIFDLDGIPVRSVRVTIHSSQNGGSRYGLSEVQFLYKPVAAREPNPADGATGVDRGTSLSWRAGREAASHLVYLDTDSNAVAEGTAQANPSATATYDPGVLALGRTYSWKVEEINDAETPSVWASPVWSFTVQEYVPIDNFDSYTDEQGNEIFSTWLDGYNVTSNGSQVGYDNPPYADTSHAHSGQAMPLQYDNTGGVAYSEAELAFSPAANWTTNGADTLSVYYRGEPTGFAQVADDEILMNGTGVDIWGTTDEFRFVYKQLTGNGSIIARIEYVDYTNEWAKAGVMIRQTLDSDSMLVDGIISADGNVGMQWRSGRAVDMGNPDASNTSADGGGTFPGWVRLTRTGDVFEVDYSTDGVTWQDIPSDAATDPQTTTVVMTDPVYIGLAVTSHATGLVAGSHFTGIATTGNVTGQWQSASIGIDQPAGNGIDRFYLTVQDSSNNTATFTNPLAAAVGMGTYQQWLIPLSDISAAGVSPTRVTKLILGVGDASAPSKNVSGILYIDDIAFGNPIE